MNSCPECRSTRIRSNSSSQEVICVNCGLVLDSKPLEKNPFIPAINHALVGTKPVNGRIVKDIWLKTTRQKNLEKTEQDLLRIAEQLHSPKIVEKEAVELLRKVIKEDLNIGRNTCTLLLACIYAACLIHNMPRLPLEITKGSDVTPWKLLQMYKLLKQELKLKIPLFDPTHLIERFGSKLSLSAKTISLTLNLIEKARRDGLFVGKQPPTIIAASLYASCKQTGEGKTQREIANAVGVIEVTIRKYFPILNRYFDDL